MNRQVGAFPTSKRFVQSRVGTCAIPGAPVVCLQPGGLQSATCPPGHLCRAYDYVFDNQNVCQKEVADLAASCGTSHPRLDVLFGSRENGSMLNSATLPASFHFFYYKEDSGLFPHWLNLMLSKDQRFLGGVDG